MEYEDALKFTIRSLRENSAHDYGYDLYLPSLLRRYTSGVERLDENRAHLRMRELSPVFFAAAWELCRKGVIRPGVRAFDQQATSDGSAGNGYSVTPFGRVWLSESDRDDFVPTEPERFGQLLVPFRDMLGAGFYTRAQEAVRCYGAHAYLACCAMCGAAAESILLRLAITKKNDEAAVLREYAHPGGRGKIENLILGTAKQQMKAEFRGFTMLMNYWRNEAAHGKPSEISDTEAYTSLALLLRFSLYVRDHWNELVTP